MEVPAGSNGTAPWREESTWCTHRNSLLPSLLGGLWPQGVFSGTFPPPSQVEQPHAAAETCAEAMSGVRAAAPWGKNSLRLLWGNTDSRGWRAARAAPAYSTATGQRGSGDRPVGPRGPDGALGGLWALWSGCAVASFNGEASSWEAALVSAVSLPESELCHHTESAVIPTRVPSS